MTIPQQALITSADSVLMLAVADLFPTPVQIQGWAVDDAWATEAVENKEIQLGVDGLMAVGWKPFLVPMTLRVSAGSNARLFFEAWLAAENLQKTALLAEGQLDVPALSTGYVMTGGALSRAMSFPAGRNVLQPLEYTITWQLVQPQPF